MQQSPLPTKEEFELMFAELLKISEPYDLPFTLGGSTMKFLDEALKEQARLDKQKADERS